MAIELRFKMVGGVRFDHEVTGGQCTALVYRKGDFEYMITKVEEPEAPDTETHEVDFGVYCGGEVCVLISGITYDQIQF